MLYAYGKLRKLIEKLYDETQLASVSGPEIIDMIEIDEIENMTTLAVLGSEFAAVGATAARLRKAIDTLKIPVLIITESMSLIENKKPDNYRVIIREEKSRKADILKTIIDNYAKWEREENVEEGESAGTGENKETADETREENLTQVKPFSAEKSEAEEMQTDTEDSVEIAGTNTSDNLDAGEASIIPETDAFTQPPRIVVKQTVVEKTVQVSLPLYNFEIQKLPKYSPIKFDSADDIIAHFRKKWNVDGVL